MYNDDNFELTHAEKEMLASLPREMAPGDMLEARVVRALRSEGHFGASQAPEKRGIAMVWKIAAAIMLFAGGVATGRYILATSASESATVTAPASGNQNAVTGAARGTRPVPLKETIVAEREMWL